MKLTCRASQDPRRFLCRSRHAARALTTWMLERFAWGRHRLGKTDAQQRPSLLARSWPCAGLSESKSRRHGARTLRLPLRGYKSFGQLRLLDVTGCLGRCSSPGTKWMRVEPISREKAWGRWRCS